jgi:hypothetical protein
MTQMKDTSLLNWSCKRFDLSDGFITLQNAVNMKKSLNSDDEQFYQDQ